MRIIAVALIGFSACSEPQHGVPYSPDGAQPGTDAAGSGSAIPPDAAPMPILGCDQAPVIPGTGAITSWSRMTGNLSVNYFGDGNKTVDITSFAAIFSYPSNPLPTWPAGYGANANIPVPTNRYVSAEFTIPANYFEDHPTYRGNYTVGESGFSADVSMTISEHCGDFGQIAPTTVVSGCDMIKAHADGILPWTGAQGDCQLESGKRYYLNIIDADVTTFPATTTLRAQYCGGGICTTPILNGFGTWSN